MIKVCDICGRELDRSDDTKDCGGTCLRCMAEVGGDPDCVEAMDTAMNTTEDEALMEKLSSD